MRKSNYLHVIFALIVAAVFAGCELHAQEAVKTTEFLATVLTISTVTPTIQSLPSTTPSPPAPPTLEKIDTPSTFEVCSPLLDYTIEAIPMMVVNPYLPPPTGRDEPHQGVDIAVRSQDGGRALEGNTVQSILSGQVAGVVDDRFPYGNAVIIETKFAELPAEINGKFSAPATPPVINPALTCPDLTTIEFSRSDQTSIYVIYAHLKEAVELKQDDNIQCGQNLGVIGSTGNAINPHLHLEARVGPSDVRIASMAHYDTSATAEEMASYCLWRVSGVFQVLNPFVLLGLTP